MAVRLQMHVLLLSVASSFVAAPKTTHAQELDDFNGVFVYAGGQKQRSAVGEAIEAIVDDMNPLFRIIARRRLTAAAKIPPRYTFKTAPGGVLTITVGAGRPLTTKVDGTPIQFKNDEGQSITLERFWKGGVLTTSGDRGDAGQKSIYRLTPDGKSLAVTIIIHSEQLPRPLRYVLTYRRQ